MLGVIKLLLESFSLLTSMNVFCSMEYCRYCDEGMIESVTTLIWSAPRLQSDVQELRVVR